MRILVTGAYGFLGTCLCDFLTVAGHYVARQGRRTGAEYWADPADRAGIGAVVGTVRPDVVVNLAAYTDVDGCERDPAAAFRANVEVPRVLVEVLRDHPQTHLIQVSTDQVYDGCGPHREDRISPPNVYGITKFAGEMVAAGANTTVMRTNFVGRSPHGGRQGLADWLVDSLRTAQPIMLFQDVQFSPLHVDTVCSVIERLSHARAAGTFNVGARGRVSKAEFALRLADRMGLNAANLRLGRQSDVKLAARRSSDMSMSVTAFESAFGFDLPTIDDEIAHLANDYASG